MEVLEGPVLAGLNGVMVLWTMVKRRVQPLKRLARLLCDYIRVEDLTHEVAEELEDDVVID